MARHLNQVFRAFLAARRVTRFVPGTQTFLCCRCKLGDRNSLGSPTKAGRSLQPSPLAECRKINSRRSIPSPCAVTSTELQSDLLVPLRASQWCSCSEIWRSRSRFDGIGLVFPSPL